MLSRSKQEIDARQLWHEVFGDSLESVSRFFGHIYREDEAFVTYVDGQVASMLLAPRLTLRIEDGIHLPIGYLCGIATHPDHRGKGMSSELIRQALRKERERGDIFSTLIPAEASLFAFYEKTAGFTPAFSEWISTGQEALIQGLNGTSPNTQTLVDFLSQAEGSSHTPLALHDEAWWHAVLEDYQLSEGYRIYIHEDERGLFDGVLFIMVQPTNEVWVRAAFGQIEACKDLLQDLANQYPRHTFRYFLPTPPTATPQPKGMLRLLNLRRLLELYLQHHPEETRAFAYRDPLFPEEDGYYLLKGGRVEKHPLLPTHHPLKQEEILAQLNLDSLRWRLYLLCEGNL